MKTDEFSAKAKKQLISVLLFIAFTVLFFEQNIYSVEEKQDSKVTIKVGFYELDGFFGYDKDGNECGYGVDFLNELKKFANIEWEYVPTDSWENIEEMMHNGEVDIWMPVSEPAQRSNEYSYTIEPVLTSYHAVMTLKSRDDLYYQDYDTISKMKIAVAKSLLKKSNFNDYLKSIGITDNLVVYDEYNACRQALDSGEVDGLISNVMDLTDDMKILEKFDVVNNYITMLPDNKYYSLINNAMTQLLLSNPSYESNLYKKYYPERSKTPMTKEENEYIAQKEYLTVAVYANRKPVSYYDEETKSFKGIAIDIGNVISKNIGIPFKYIPITGENVEDMFDKADLVMPVQSNPDIEKYFVTSSILESEVIMAVKTSKSEINEGDKIGVLKSTKGIYRVLSNNENFDIISFDSNREALKALQRGEIKGFANSSYVINWMLDNPRFMDLSILNYQSIPLVYDICGKNEDKLLLSILNKGIAAISDSEKDKIIQEDSRFSIGQLSFTDKIYIYRNEIFAAAVLLICVLTAVALYTHSRTKYIHRIEESNKKQKKANEAKSEFLARMSHDMRTPLNVIMGMSHLAEDNDNPEDTDECLGKINVASEFLLGLINDVLDMEHMESGKMELHLLPYSGAEFNQYIQSVISPLCEQKNINFEYSYDGKNDFVVMQDKLRINQVYFNLLSNAVKFTPEGGKILFHTHFEWTENSSVIMDVTISDNGIGMSKEFQKQMFEPFAQENQVFKPIAESTGLGLSIVKRICDMMNMEISVKSDIGKGTTFTLHGEYKIAEENVIEKTKTEHQYSAYKDNILKDKTFLVCEDHHLNQEIIKRLLEKKGSIVILADDGKRGIEIFKKSAPGSISAILMDIRMPVINGIEAAKIIRALDKPDAASIPIIALTANAYEEDVKQCMDAGMNEHLSKPIEPDKFYETLKKYV